MVAVLLAGFLSEMKETDNIPTEMIPLALRQEKRPQREFAVLRTFLQLASLVCMKFPPEFLRFHLELLMAPQTFQSHSQSSH